MARSKELKDTDETIATFDASEVYSFHHASILRDRYLQKVALRELPHRRLDEFGQEALSPRSTVIDVDMQPLSMRQNIARFIGRDYDPASGFDTDDSVDDDADFFASDDTDNIPTPHELRARDLDRRLTRARKAHAEAAASRRDSDANKASTEAEKNRRSDDPDAAKAAPASSIPKE